MENINIALFFEIAEKTILQMHYLPQIILFLFVSTLVSEVLFKYFPKFIKIIGLPFEPLVRLCNLPAKTASILISALGSSYVAHSATSNLFSQKILTDQETILATVLSTVPTYLRRLIAHYAIIIIPLLGWKFFGAFALCYIAPIFSKIIFCIIYGKLRLTPPESNAHDTKNEKSKKHISLKDSLKEIAKNINQYTQLLYQNLLFNLNRCSCFFPLTMGVIVLLDLQFKKNLLFYLLSYWLIYVFYKIISPTIYNVFTFFKSPLRLFHRITVNIVLLTFLALFVINTGFVDSISGLIVPLVDYCNLSDKLTVPLLTFLSGQLQAGAIVLSDLLNQGLITASDALMTIAMGMIINLPIFTLRHIIPCYISIFGKNIGLKITGISVLIVLVTRIAVVMLLFLIL